MQVLAFNSDATLVTEKSCREWNMITTYEDTVSVEIYAESLLACDCRYCSIFYFVIMSVIYFYFVRLALCNL